MFWWHQGGAQAQTPAVHECCWLYEVKASFTSPQGNAASHTPHNRAKTHPLTDISPHRHIQLAISRGFPWLPAAPQSWAQCLNCSTDSHCLAVLSQTQDVSARDGSNWGGGCPSLPPPCCDEASRYASQKNPVTDSATQGTRRQAGQPFHRGIQCKPLHTATNRFFLFLGSPPGFLFTVTVQQGSHSLSLSLSVPLSSSLTVRALELEASVEMLPKEQWLRRNGLHGSFFVDMPRQKHTADHTDIPLSFDP